MLLYWYAWTVTWYVHPISLSCVGVKIHHFGVFMFHCGHVHTLPQEYISTDIETVLLSYIHGLSRVALNLLGTSATYVYYVLGGCDWSEHASPAAPGGQKAAEKAGPSGSCVCSWEFWRGCEKWSSHARGRCRSEHAAVESANAMRYSIMPTCR